MVSSRATRISAAIASRRWASSSSRSADRSIDLAFQSGPFGVQTSGNEDLGVFPMVWIASPETGLQHADSVGIEDLVRYPILTHARGTVPYDEVAAHFGARHDLPVRLVPSSNIAACIQMTIDGFGVATVPEAMVASELCGGELVRIGYAWTPHSLSFSARYDAHRAAPFVARAAALAGEISQRFAREFEARDDDRAGSRRQAED